jgi:ABC-type uncharacterized transport system permease subunit
MKTNKKKANTSTLPKTGVEAESRHLADFTPQSQNEPTKPPDTLWAVFVAQRFLFQTTFGLKVSITGDQPDYFLPVFTTYDKAVAWAKEYGYSASVVVELTSNVV